MKLNDADLKALAEAEHSTADLRRCLEKLKRIDPVMAPRCDAVIDAIYDFLEKTLALEQLADLQ
jgi:hypothetical protein